MDSANKDDKLTKVVGWFNKQLYNLIDWIFRKKSKDYSPDFKKLFFKNEIWALYGDQWSNFWKIIMLYIALFISVGFGVKSYQFFKQQLDSPFVRFIPVLVQGNANLDSTFVNSLQERFMADSTKSYYLLDTIRTLSTEIKLQFSSDKVQKDFYGMADDYNSALVLEAVCSKGNNYIGRPFGSVEERSVIITLNLLKDLRLVDQDVTINGLSIVDIPSYIMVTPDGLGREVPLLVQGVTDQLPYESDFLLPSKFNDYWQYDINSLFYKTEGEKLSYYIDTTISINELKKVIYPIVATYGINPDDGNMIIEATSSIHSSVLVSISNITNSVVHSVLRQSLIDQLKLDSIQIVDAFYNPYDHTGEGWLNEANQPSMLVVFKDLAKVRLFNDSLKSISSKILTQKLMNGSDNKVNGVEIEMEKIKLRDIFNLIEFIVVGFIVIIAFLAGTSLMSFVKVIFEKYFQKIEKNIGTFMAFGINIKVIYAIMLTKFVFTTVLFSFLLAAISGEAIEWAVKSAQDLSGSLFSVCNISMIGVLVLIIISNWYAFSKASKIFEEWPGDIINDRQTKNDKSNFFVQIRAMWSKMFGKKL